MTPVAMLVFPTLGLGNQLADSQSVFKRNTTSLILPCAAYLYRARRNHQFLI
ncbi:hypothetical protein PSPO01_16140 [Paraphaeosphaeria sporulosa]